MLEITKAVAPAATESFERNTLYGVRFNGAEMAELKRRLGSAAGNNGGKGEGLADAQLLAHGQEPLLKGKALDRFEEKLRSGKQI